MAPAVVLRINGISDLEFMANKPDVTKILAKSVKISEDRLELTVASVDTISSLAVLQRIAQPPLTVEAKFLPCVENTEGCVSASDAASTLAAKTLNQLTELLGEAGLKKAAVSEVVQKQPETKNQKQSSTNSNGGSGVSAGLVVGITLLSLLAIAAVAIAYYVHSTGQTFKFFLKKITGMRGGDQEDAFIAAVRSASQDGRPSRTESGRPTGIIKHGTSISTTNLGPGEDGEQVGSLADGFRGSAGLSSQQRLC